MRQPCIASKTLQWVAVFHERTTRCCAHLQHVMISMLAQQLHGFMTMQAEHTQATAAQQQQPAADQLNDVPCARSMAASDDHQEGAVILRVPRSVAGPPLDAVQPPSSSTPAKRGYDVIHGSAPDSGMAAALNGSSGKRPRLAGHADQHFMQQALGVAQ